MRVFWTCCRRRRRKSTRQSLGPSRRTCRRSFAPALTRVRCLLLRSARFWRIGGSEHHDRTCIRSCASLGGDRHGDGALPAALAATMTTMEAASVAPRALRDIGNTTAGARATPSTEEKGYQFMKKMFKNPTTNRVPRKGRPAPRPAGPHAPSAMLTLHAMLPSPPTSSRANQSVWSVLCPSRRSRWPFPVLTLMASLSRQATCLPTPLALPLAAPLALLRAVHWVVPRAKPMPRATLLAMPTPRASPPAMPTPRAPPPAMPMPASLLHE